MDTKLLIYCVFFMFSTGINTLRAQIKNTGVSNLSLGRELIHPPYLKTGDTVAIVSPSSVLKNRDKDAVDKAVQLLKSWGLNTVLGKHIYKQYGHFAGSDEERSSDFQKAMDDPKIKAIWCTRGGYGSVRILDKLDYTKFKQNPKWIIGYSDITGIHNQIHIQGIESIHALMCSSLSGDPKKTREAIKSFKYAIFGDQLKYTVGGSKYNKKGITQGQLVGGNLTLLHTMLGSKTSIDISGKILFIEEIGEYAYRIDRMLQSLKRAGYFNNCKGVIVGGIIKVKKNTIPFGRSVQQIILDIVKDYDFPLLFNFPSGHLEDNRALILGRTITLNVGKESSSVVFSK